ncbi:MAG: hypothetical protein R2736_10925 [Solirubrobacterales bacterium]
MRRSSFFDGVSQVSVIAAGHAVPLPIGRACAGAARREPVSLPLGVQLRRASASERQTAPGA